MGSIRKWPLLINDDDDDDDNDNAVVNQEEYSITVQSQYSFYAVVKILGSTYIGSAFNFGPFSCIFIFCNK